MSTTLKDLKYISFILILMLSILSLSLVPSHAAANQCPEQFDTGKTSTSAKIKTLFISKPETLTKMKYMVLSEVGTDKANWLQKTWRYIPQQISKRIFKQDNYQFSPFSNLQDSFFHYAVDIPLSSSLKFFFNKNYTISTHLKNAIIISLLVYAGYSEHQAEIAAEKITHERIELIVEREKNKSQNSLQLNIDDINYEFDIRFKLLGLKQVSKKEFENILTSFYTGNTMALSPLLHHIDTLNQSMRLQNLDSTEIEKLKSQQIEIQLLTTAFLQQLLYLDEFLHDRTNWEARKTLAFSNGDYNKLQEIASVENFLFSTKLYQAYKEKKISANQLKKIIQTRFFQSYILELSKYYTQQSLLSLGLLDFDIKRIDKITIDQEYINEVKSLLK